MGHFYFLILLGLGLSIASCDDSSKTISSLQLSQEIPTTPSSFVIEKSIADRLKKITEILDEFNSSEEIEESDEIKSADESKYEEKGESEGKDKSEQKIKSPDEIKPDNPEATTIETRTESEIEVTTEPISMNERTTVVTQPKEESRFQFFPQIIRILEKPILIKNTDRKDGFSIGDSRPLYSDVKTSNDPLKKLFLNATELTRGFLNELRSMKNARVSEGDDEEND